MPQDDSPEPPSSLFGRLGAAVTLAASSVAGHLTRPTHGGPDRSSPTGNAYKSSLLDPIPSRAMAHDSRTPSLYLPTPKPHHFGTSQPPPPLSTSRHGHRYGGDSRPPTNSSKGEGRGSSNDYGWSADAGGFHGQAGHRAASSLPRPDEPFLSVYDVPMKSAFASADQAARIIETADRGSPSCHTRSGVHDRCDCDESVPEIECTGLTSRAPVPPPTSSHRPSLQTSGSSSSAQTQQDWAGPSQRIHVPNGGRHGGASAQRGFSSSSDPYVTTDPYASQKYRHQPLKGTKQSVGTRQLKAADAAERRAAKDVDPNAEGLRAAMEATHQREMERYKKDKQQKNSSPFMPGRNTIKAPSSAVQTPPPGQVAGSHKQSSHLRPDAPPSCSRDGGSHHRPLTIRSPVQQFIPTPTRPSVKPGPPGDSRQFALEGDSALGRPAKGLQNGDPFPLKKTSPHFQQKKPPPGLPDFKKKTPMALPVPAASKDAVIALKRRRASNEQQQPVVLDDTDEEDGVPIASQRTEDIGEFDDEDDVATSSRPPPAAASKPAPTVRNSAKNLLDARPPVDLNPLPMAPQAQRPIFARDDGPPVPIIVPKEGTVRKKGIVGGMGSSKGGLIQTSLPTAMTRGQRSQLAGGTTLILPKCKVYCDGVPARQCILSIQAEKLVVESAAHVDIISIPLHHVKALQYSEPNGTPYVVLRAQLDLVGLPSALEPFQVTTFVWKFPHEDAKGLDAAWTKMTKLPQLTGGQSGPSLSLKLLSKATTTKLLGTLEAPASGSKKAPPSLSAPVATRAVANQGPIAIDDSDEEDGEVNFPDLKPTLASAPRSVVTRGKQREAGPSAKAGPPREPPPANPHELMCNWPATGRPEISILKGDYHRTTHKDEYLNDTIIDWGLKSSFAREKLTRPNLEDDVYIFSSFLYFKLTEPNVLKSKKDPWESVRSWTTKKVEGKKEKELKIDLFKKKYIIVPINESYHWYLAIIVNPAAVLQPPPPKPSPTRKPLLPSMATTTRAAAAPATEEPMDVDSEPEFARRPPASRADSELLIVESRPTTPPQKTTEDLLEVTADRIVDDAPTGSGQTGNVAEAAAADDVETPPTLDEVGENETPERKHGYIFILDSLGNATVKPAGVLSKYLRSEGIAHQGWQADAESTILTADKVDVPRQGDESSCGVYLLHYAEVFLRDPEKAVDFMLHTRKPKRGPGGSAQHKELLSQYEAQRNAFWTASELEGKREGYRLALLALETEYVENERAKAAQRDPSAEAKSKSPDSSPVEQASAAGTESSEPPVPDVPPTARPSPPPQSPPTDVQEPAVELVDDAANRPASHFFSPATPPGKEMASRSPSPAPEVGSPVETEPLDLTTLRGSLPARPATGSPGTAGDSRELASHVSATPEDDAQASNPAQTADVEEAVDFQTGQHAPVAAQPSEEKVARQTQATPYSSSSSVPGVLSVSRQPSLPVEVHDSSDDEPEAAGTSRRRPETDSDDMNLFKNDDDDGDIRQALGKRRAPSPASSGSSGRRQTKRLKATAPSGPQPVLRFSAPGRHGSSPPPSSQPANKKARYTVKIHGQPSVDSHSRPPKLKDGGQPRKAAYPTSTTSPTVIDVSDDDSDDSSVHATEKPARRLSTEI